MTRRPPSRPGRGCVVQNAFTDALSWSAFCGWKGMSIFYHSSFRRAPSQQSEVEVGIEQVQELCRPRHAEMHQDLYLIIADAKYGNHRFLAPLRDEPCGVLVRLRGDRVLYGAPGAYSGRGRPRVHGERFAFKEPETWGEPDALVELEHPHRGKTRLRRWDNKHARQDAATPFSVNVKGRFASRDVDIQDVDLYEVLGKRVLKPVKGRRKALDEAVKASLSQIPGEQLQVLYDLYGQKRFEGAVRALYPFHPAIVDTLVSVTHMLSRERTAISVMYDMLLDPSPDSGQSLADEPLGTLIPYHRAFHYLIEQASKGELKD
ncbi:MAG: transposase [Anaerolineae bacterium]|nr:transposase [Anaerolineae bacterium]